MRTNYVMIDFESVQPSGWELEQLRHDHFKTLVFVGALQGKVSFDTVAVLQSMGGNADYVKISGSGKNALDFHIAYYIGRLVEKDPKAYFHINSGDRGYDPLIEHLKGKRVLAARSPSIGYIHLVKVGNARSPDERARLFIARLDQPKATKPRTLKTLTSSVGAFFQKQLTDADVSAAIAAMEKARFITISNGKVTYASDG